MATSLQHIHDHSPMGANLIADGAIFKTWAPYAQAVYVIGEFNQYARNDASLLNRQIDGVWAGFIPGVEDRQRYKFYVIGEGSEGPKRDPYARELQTPFPSDCIIRKPDFPWHETGFQTPAFEDFLIYQLHVGTFFTPRLPKGGTFLDVALKIPHFANLGITAIQLLPIQEFQTEFSLGYNGTDYFSPEMDFAVEDAFIETYLAPINALLSDHGQAHYHPGDLRGEMNQLKALIDLCHVYGIAVILDVVYNHAGGDFGAESLYFFDRQSFDNGGNLNSLYFTDKGHAGGLVFDFAKPEVREFLIQNARYFLDEYRIDGIRYDQVSVIDHDGAPHGWDFCQDLTSTLKYHRPSALHKAEYWNVNPFIVKQPPTGAGFDTTLTDGLRIALRDVIANSSRPDERPLPMQRLGQSLWPEGFPEHWRFVQGPENHDIVYLNREPRIARLADPSNPRSWFGRSRSRVAAAISLTAPGIPMLFMGQEFLEDKPWSDNLEFHQDLLLHWKGIDQDDKQMTDHIRFWKDAIALRHNHPALRGQGFRAIHSHDENRVLAWHRWTEQGGDVIIVAHLATHAHYDYRVGFPKPGKWREIFNSDFYENYPNPDVTGNNGSVEAQALPLHGFAYSAPLTLPANSLLVFSQA
ncbi:alpha amylase C-terminal domain-containing protein [Dyadobacter sp. CY261]|uniref:alpha amylase C-terminal domain-containing protein n=1 Tax=Dyadobacter sp. CY261 TaxID=2907203 RepID=UPI001F1F5116|nr:alpha-amylase family glycosyl hydrolase [Dyadobacter sp. CY261]MCF0072927.1 alpha amylase C-terminal domain-containing protein [Dyadobacter sp. CY261]